MIGRNGRYDENKKGSLREAARDWIRMKTSLVGLHGVPLARYELGIQ
jgi:hypothetical protein